AAPRRPHCERPWFPAAPVAAGAPRAAPPGGFSFGGADFFAPPTIGAWTPPAPAPTEPAKPAAAPPGKSWRGPQDGCPPWLEKSKPNTERVNGGPPQTVSGDEAKERMARVNSDRAPEYEVMAAPKFTGGGGLRK